MVGKVHLLADARLGRSKGARMNAARQSWLAAEMEVRGSRQTDRRSLACGLPALS